MTAMSGVETAATESGHETGPNDRATNGDNGHHPWNIVIHHRHDTVIRQDIMISHQDVKILLLRRHRHPPGHYLSEVTKVGLQILNDGKVSISFEISSIWEK